MLFELNPVEAELVPEREKNEAAKDYEQRLAKFCAWLDEKGCTEISFEVPSDGSVALVSFVDREDVSETVSEGLYLVWSESQEHFKYWGREVFEELYRPVRNG